jgi:cell division protein FtsL
MSTRLNILLLVALLASALYQVRTSHEARRLFVALEAERVREAQLQTEYEQLDVAKRSQAVPLRVERLAREKLRMFNASPALTQYVGLSEAAVPPAASAPAAGGSR